MCGRNMIIWLTYTLYFGLGCYDLGENNTFPHFKYCFFRGTKIDRCLGYWMKELETQQSFIVTHNATNFFSCRISAAIRSMGGASLQVTGTHYFGANVHFKG